MRKINQKHSLKEHIRQAALQVFSQKGYSGTSVAEIACQAGANPATIYRFFSGKRELFASLQRPDLDFPDQREQQRRHQIMDTALKIFSEKGYAAATMDDIAETAGLSKAGVYFYFQSKEKLFEAAAENPAAFNVLNPILDELKTKDEVDIREGLVRLVKAFLCMFENEDFVCLLKVILSEGVRNASIAAVYREKILNIGAEKVSGFLVKYGDLEQDKLAFAVRSLFGMLVSWGFLNCLLAKEDEGQKFDLDEVAKMTVDQFLNGIQNSLIMKEQLEGR